MNRELIKASFVRALLTFAEFAVARLTFAQFRESKTLFAETAIEGLFAATIAFCRAILAGVPEVKDE